MIRCRKTHVAVLVTLGASACTSPTQESTASLLEVAGEGEVLFLVQNAIPNVVMDALVEGHVVADDAGCLRLDGPDPATVVWPFRFALDGQ